MGIHALILELVIIFWYIKDVLNTTHKSLFSMIIVLLIYLCLKVIYNIFSKKKSSHFISWFLVFFIALSSLFVFESMSYFFVMNLAHSLHRLNKRLTIFGILGIILGVVLTLELDIYLMISLLTFINVYTALKNQDDLIIEKSKRFSSDISQLKLSKKQMNIDLYESNLEHTTRLEERNEIAQKLHDELGHTLSGSTMQLEAALLILDHDQEKAKNMFQRVILNLREGTEAIRQILKSIKPETASINIQTIKTMAAQVKEKSNIQVDVVYNNELIDLTYKYWQSILINMQEAMTNMMKYSNASRCTITFERLNKMFKVTIKDNGIGCSVIKKNIGLEGMTNRMVDINGQLVLDGSNGFSIVMLYPNEKGEPDVY